MLNSKDIRRYQRHFNLPKFGKSGQEMLKKANILVVGCGGLGGPVSLYLAAAGVGSMGILDFDIVTESNLQRQTQFSEEQIGNNKVDALKQRLEKLNSSINLSIYNKELTRFNALDILKDYDLIVDCTDNFPTRYLVNDTCEILNKPFIYGSIYQYEGQVSVFNYDNGPTYRDLFPTPPTPDSVPNCEIGGVIGSLAGIIGSIQANEAIKVICELDGILKDKLFIFDTESMLSRTIRIKKDSSRLEITKLIDYQDFCNKNMTDMVKEITVHELDDMMKKKEDFQLIDVREPHEVDICSLNGELIPLGSVPEHIDQIDTGKKVVVHCRSGARSAQAIQYLQEKGGLTNLYNLKGGILAWADEIDPAMTKY